MLPNLAVGAAEWSRADFVPADPSSAFSDDTIDEEGHDDRALLSP